MHLGITGTQQGINAVQRDWMRAWLTAHASEIKVVHHGDCTGADADIHDLVRELVPQYS